MAGRLKTTKTTSLVSWGREVEREEKLLLHPLCIADAYALSRKNALRFPLSMQKYMYSPKLMLGIESTD